MKKYVFLIVIIFFILSLNFVFEFKKYNVRIESARPFCILPYNGKSWIVDSNGKIIDVMAFPQYDKLFVLRIPQEDLNLVTGRINEKYLQLLPESVPEFIFEVDFVNSRLILLNSAVVYFSNSYKLREYIESLKLLYHYTESGSHYYIKNNKLIKVR
ncbi:DUF4894 domain-containing protein [Thermosipho ferrireducens]|uniref:DUF4894 domain-containing protein n=1 Tax=Thermosipho ferrireducens TaxID=2571116 RepID=A0ABX7S545_9BACT|nr:DUF4894 domain-containing protein [Thermosipho ferrireducens]QTA37244.1 DUF4894 domain-containing protein [Thermosipho ferrireducens]